MFQKEIGDSDTLSGTLDGVKCKMFAAKEPDYTSKIMSTYGSLVVHDGATENTMMNLENVWQRHSNIQSPLTTISGTEVQWYDHNKLRRASVTRRSVLQRMCGRRRQATMADGARDRPNKELSPEERRAKRCLKKELKAQQKRAKLETRLRHARVRKDPRVEEETRLALAANHEIRHQQEEPEEESSAREFLIQILRDLQSRNHASSVQQKDRAVSLLRHMTKATQEKHMFANVDALWGYTRHKFLERALLVFSSFAKLRQDERLWRKLLAVKSVCSIGCGPACDAVGVAAFLKSFSPTTSTAIQSVILMDWAIAKWQHVLTPLSNIVVPSIFGKMVCVCCDVTKPFDRDAFAKDIDLYLFSYILTETRGQWESFMMGLIHEARVGSLFYFAEPTPWQLHKLQKLWKEYTVWVWLDSSMNSPRMQVLDGRVGPGVLLVEKHRDIPK